MHSGMNWGKQAHAEWPQGLRDLERATNLTL